MQIEKTVFISYRRTNAMTARAVYQDLMAHGYDVFLDYLSIDSGSFENVILNQIAARAHFIVVLTPSALERCSDPKDWLRREIEYALEMKRNIVPLMFDGFSFKDVQQYLVDKLAMLPQYNALNIHPDYFDEGMERLRTRFLNKSLDVILHPTPKDDEAQVKQAQANEATQSSVSEEQLNAEKWFEDAEKKFQAGDWQGVIDDCNEAIRLNPQYAAPYFRRGAAKGKLGDINSQLSDCNKAVELGTNDPRAYINRGNAHYDKADMGSAIADYSEAIRLNSQIAEAYSRRGWARHNNSDIAGAIADYDEAIRLNPNDAATISNRAIACREKPRLDGPYAHYNKSIRLDPQNAELYYNRGLACLGMGDLDGAIEDCDEAIRLNPEFADAYRCRGRVYEEIDNLKQANADYQRYVDLGGKEAERYRKHIKYNEQEMQKKK